MRRERDPGHDEHQRARSSRSAASARPSVRIAVCARLAGQLADRRDGDERERDGAADPDGGGEDVEDDERGLEPVRHVRTRIETVEREDWNRKHGEGGRLFGSEPNRFLVAEVDGLAPGRALDLACGSGRNAVWLAAQGWTVTGADFSDVGLVNAAELAAERGVDVEWLDADLPMWEPPAGAFDLVVVLYLQILAASVASCSRGRPARSRPAGRCWSSATTSRTWTAATAGRRARRCCSRRTRSPRELAGLEIETAERVLRPVETEDGEAQAIDALVRRSAPR